MNTALKKKLIKIIGIISVLLVLTVCGLYIARNSLLKISMDRRIAKAKREQGLSISYQSLELKGVSHIEMNGLAIIPEQRDTLLQLQTLRLEFNFWKLFGGHLEVKDVQLDKLKIQLIKRDSIANYDFLFQKEKKETPSKKEEYNYVKQADELLELAFDLLPENGEIRHLSVTHQCDTNLIEVKVPLLTIKNN
ncbi:MAG: penicillin-binding protein, partial [Bacteroides graminisolvens]